VAENPSGPQAFRLGRHLGLQFHPEVTPQIVGEWIAGSREGDLDSEAMLADTAREFDAAGTRALGLFAGFIAGAA